MANDGISLRSPRAEAAAGCKSKVGPLQDFETFHGFMSTPSDGLLILDACRKGALRLLKERPKVLLKTADKTSDGGKESSSVAIRSGTIVVFEEHETRMKRWRDGLKWTPSRVCGPFLIYRYVCWSGLHIVLL
ncbi:Gti1/Pac2 family-domain-containing protein [Phlyctochytrium arcticum]|nr:Gti1/Pac2 family-domain-containing protein [Phlyctochytrium arcticum]